MVAMPVLWPIHERAGLERIVVSTYQAVSGGGLAGVRELEEQLQKTADRCRSAHVLGHGRRVPAAYGLPRADRPQRHLRRRLRGRTTDRARPTRSRSSATRAGRSSASRTSPLVCTCVRVPVFCGHSVAITIELERELSVDRGDGDSRDGSRRGARRRADTAQGRRRRRVARRADPYAIRPSRTDSRSFVAGDNLRKGAALNAVQIARVLMKIGRLAADTIVPLQ